MGDKIPSHCHLSSHLLTCQPPLPPALHVHTIFLKRGCSNHALTHISGVSHTSCGASQLHTLCFSNSSSLFSVVKGRSSQLSEKPLLFLPCLHNPGDTHHQPGAGKGVIVLGRLRKGEASLASESLSPGSCDPDSSRTGGRGVNRTTAPTPCTVNGPLGEWKHPGSRAQAGNSPTWVKDKE